MADQWWDLGEKEEAAGQKRLRLRAAYWYRAAASDLVGVVRDKVQKRLEEAASLETTAGAGPEAKKALYRAYEGTWIVRYLEIGRGRRYVIGEGGDVSWGPYRGLVTHIGGETVIDFRAASQGGLDRVKLVRTPGGDTLLVEHFASAAAFPNQVASHGDARRLKKDPKQNPARLLRSVQGTGAVDASPGPVKPTSRPEEYVYDQFRPVKSATLVSRPPA